MTTKKLDLTNVTLAGLVWNDNSDLRNRVIRVLRWCQHLACFWDTVLFSSHDPGPLPGITVYQISELTRETFTPFYLKTAGRYLESDYLMWINADGFPLRPELWSKEFLAYDFIGAPWVDHSVGNDGFSIFSRRLLQALEKRLGFIPTHTNGYHWVPGDLWLCHHSGMEKLGLTRAPWEVALRFSKETILRPEPSFGFHGAALNKEDYQLGWHLIEELERQRMQEKLQNNPA